MDNASIKGNIKNIRKQQGLTQEEVSHKLGISLTAYRDLENGETSIINSRVHSLSEIFNVSTETLCLGYEPNKENAGKIEEMQSDYGSRIQSLEQRIIYLEKIICGLEAVVESKEEIISMLKKNLVSEK